MTNTVDYFITHIRNNENNVLTNVKMRDSLESNSIEKTYTKEQVISLIEKGKKIKTAYKKDNKLVEGSIVKIVVLDGKKYLRTDNNKIAKDNLDNLPFF